LSIFDGEAAGYDSWFESPLGRFADEAETECALELLNPSPGMRVLDAGCGTGNFSLKLARMGCSVTGADISENMLAVARKKAAAEGLAAEFVIMDVLDLEYPDESFDAAVSMAAFEFIPDREKALGEMLRAVKRGGVALVGTINRNSAWGEMYAEAAKMENSVFRHARLMTASELADLGPHPPEEVRECLFIPPGAGDDELCPEGERKYYRKGRGGFLCALWRKP
jgi:ubiquinone/menaquinone biosynthesis C-methylase UbiE